MSIIEVIKAINKNQKKYKILGFLDDKIKKIKGINNYNSNIDVYDPWANKKKVKNICGINLIKRPHKAKYHAIILAVAHDDFKKFSLKQI